MKLVNDAALARMRDIGLRGNLLIGNTWFELGHRLYELIDAFI